VGRVGEAIRKDLSATITSVALASLAVILYDGDRFSTRFVGSLLSIDLTVMPLVAPSASHRAPRMALYGVRRRRHRFVRLVLLDVSLDLGLEGRRLAPPPSPRYNQILF